MTVKLHPYGTEKTVVDNLQGGDAATDTVAFYGTTPIVQPSGAAAAALTLTTATSGGFGFSTSAGFIAALAQLEEIRATLVELGLHAGS